MTPDPASTYITTIVTVTYPPSSSAFRTLRESIASQSMIGQSDTERTVGERETPIEICEVPRSAVCFGSAVFQGESWPWLWYIWQPYSVWNIEHKAYPISVPRGQKAFPVLAGFMEDSRLPAGFLDTKDDEWETARENFMTRYRFVDRKMKHVPPCLKGTAWRPPMNSHESHSALSRFSIPASSSRGFIEETSAHDVVHSELVSEETRQENTTSPSISSLGWGMLIPAKAESFASFKGFETALELFKSVSARQRQVYELEFFYYCERRGIHTAEAVGIFKDLLYREYTSTLRKYYLTLRGVSPKFTEQESGRTMNGNGCGAITSTIDDCARWLESADRGSVLLEVIPLAGVEIEARAWGVFIPHLV